MNLEDLRRLSPEQAMQAASKELALPSDFFDRMWAQESGRGKNKFSPAGARGDFQIMPTTQATWERRNGKSFDADNFYDSLFMASETMRENLARFKDPIDATRAYNGGWDSKKWKNAETTGYVQALWGNQVPAKPGAVPADASPEDWPRLPTLRKGKPAPDSTDETNAMVDIGTSAQRLAKDAAGVDSVRATGVAREAEQAKAQTRKDGTGFQAVVHDALRDARVMPTWSILSRLEGDRPDPTFNYMGRREELEAGLNDDEREYMRENSISEDSARTARAQIEYRRGLDRTYSDAGAFNTFTGQMTGGVTDPASLFAGLGVIKAFQMMRIGSAALAAQGRAGAAAASMLGENAAANVAIEGLADAVGEVKTSGDYAMAAASGALLAAPFTRGVVRTANEAAISNHARAVHEKAVGEQAAAVTKVMTDEPHLTPEQAARKVEEREAETISKAVNDSVGPNKQEAVIPDDVRRAMEDEFTGVVPEDTTAKAVEPTDTKQVDPVPKEPPSVIDQMREGIVTREVTDTSGTGQKITLSWNAKGSKQKAHGNLAEALVSVHTHPLATPIEKRLATYLTKVMSADSLQVDIRVAGVQGRSMFDPNGPQVRVNDSKVAGVEGGLTDKIHKLSAWGLSSMLHEVVHVATYHRINAWEKAGGKLRPDQARIMRDFEDLYERFKAQVAENLPKTRKVTNGDGTQYLHTISSEQGARYAAKNLHEFAAQFFTDKQTRDILSAMEGKPVAGRSTNALRELLSIIKRVLGLEGRNAFEEGAKIIDQMIAMPLDNVFHKNGQNVLFAPQPSNGINPIAAQRSRDTWAEKMTQYAQNYVARNPIDLARLKVLTAKIGGASDGLVLAASKNPIMQLVASLVTETTTGAAGRQSNVAIRSHMLHKKFVGNTMIDYDAAYTVYRGKNGGGVIEDVWRGDVRRKFDQTVYEEVLNRRVDGYTPHRDQAVVEAADALQGLFERARIGQVDAGVLGWANLPKSSKGYLPQALDGVKLQAATPADLALLHKALADQFVTRLGFDQKFAEQFAPFYTERVRRRSMGEKNIDGLGAGGDGLQLVRDTLDEMHADPSLMDKIRAAESKQGQGHTKARLDVDLLAELRPGLRMMDFYVSNPLILARSYSKRTAGTVALTEAGIHGIRGVRELRQASMFKQDAQPNKQELDAYDRVMAEILGTPVAGSVVSAGASNMSLLVTLQRLGGLVFTQAAETFNMIHHLGLRSVLSGIPELPKMLGEVGRLKKGGDSGNHILTSIEAYGGEIGTDAYKMVAPLDAPDARLAEYMDQPGLVTRLMRAGGHMQSKISGFRGLMAAQHRMVAEQIVMKAARYIRDGKSDIALRDMGFSPEVAASLRNDLKHVAKWDANDRLVEFDLTRVSDARTAEAFVQAVHRGTSQIIQGTFVGERNAWFHNDYMRLLLQLRTFGLTATEKQWGRARMNHGTTYAAAMLMAQMALALPIHAARVQLMSAGREDRDKYIKDNMKPAALVRATMNYSSMSGMTGDVLELLTQTAGGWGNQQAKDALAVRAQGVSTRSLVPAVASVDQLARVAGGKTDLHTALKQLPFSNLWYLVPAINLTKD